MIEKFYKSNLTGEIFTTEEEALAAEEAVAKAEEEKKAKAEKRAERAKEVEEAFEEARKANEKAHKILNAFLEDYGSFHKTYKGASFPSIADAFFNLIW